MSIVSFRAENTPKETGVLVKTIGGIYRLLQLKSIPIPNDLQYFYTFVRSLEFPKHVVIRDKIITRLSACIEDCICPYSYIKDSSSTLSPEQPPNTGVVRITERLTLDLNALILCHPLVVLFLYDFIESEGKLDDLARDVGDLMGAGLQMFSSLLADVNQLTDSMGIAAEILTPHPHASYTQNRSEGPKIEEVI